ncbi:hypothetical protein [Streptomyces sp. NPDC008150]|uniref:hypothetical protein n=1 Tax=Streptomyces sp. NPDC008150 TaxID=3364816 RepID=UPI0036E6DE21
MPAISVGSVEVDIIPNAQGILGRLQRALIPPATQVGDEVGKIIGQRIAAQIGPAVRDGINDGARAAKPAATRQGADTGGAFARSLRAKLTEAFRSMPKLDVKLGDTGVDAELARLRARLETLSGKQIGVDVDVAAADAEIADIEEKLRRLGAAHPNVAVRADTAAARAALAEIREEIDRISANPGRVRIETDGGLGARLRAAVERAEASLPNINIGADTTEAQVQIAQLRGSLTSLRDARVGIDIDAGTALARITEIQAKLARLSAADADVAVRVDAGAASAQLAAFQAQVNSLDGQHIDVDSSGATSSMNALVAAAITVGPAILPVLPAIAAGLGAVAAAGTAAAAGVGSVALVAVPAIKQIGTVLQAQTAAQNAATQSTNSGAAAGASAARQALQQASAAQSLATARRNAAQQVAEAERAVGDAVKSAAKANAQAASQVKSARQSLADAYTQAADRMEAANEDVASAEKDLASAQKSAKQAQLDLTAARKQAGQELEDLNNQLTDSALSQRDAEIQLKEATAQRNAVLSNAASTALDKQKALLQYDQAVQRLKEQQTETKRLKDETAAANKAGVEGSQTVKSAQEQLASAQQDVVDKTAALKDAQADVTKTQIDNSRQIADAQEKLSEAQKNVAETQAAGAEAVARAQERVVQAQQSGADSIASAQRQIASASLSAAGGVDQAATAQAKYQAELAKLTPAARQTMGAYLDLKDAFSGWSKALQPQVMPLFTRALVSLRNTLPTLTPFVKGAVTAISELQDRASKQVRNPFWQGFKKDIASSVTPAIVGLGVAFGNLIKGMAGIVDAFLPHMDGISDRMQNITKRFANWGAGLKGSPEFEAFLDYVKQTGPEVGEFLGKAVSAMLAFSKAIAPTSGVIFAVVGPLLDGIKWLSDNMPGLIQTLWGMYAVSKAVGIATKAWAVAEGLYSTAMTIATLETWSFAAALAATGWTEIVALITAIVVVIAALVAGVIYAYNHWGWFRTAVDATWSAIKAVTLAAWNGVLKPVFAGIWTALKGVGAAALWLWTNAVGPAFGFIVAAFRVWWTAVKVYLTVAGVLFYALGAAALWLWDHAISPMIGWVIAGFKLWWTAIRVQFNLFTAGLKAIGDAAKGLWTKYIHPAISWIADGFKALYAVTLKPLFGHISDGLRVVGDWFKKLWKSYVSPAMSGIKSAMSTAYDHSIKPLITNFKTIIGSLGKSFADAVAAIKRQWDKIKAISKAPIAFVVNTVYNKGLVGVWNKIASAFGAPKLTKYSFAEGGVMPGYTPGKDVHQFVSPTGGALELSGGESFFRPEFTRGVGSGFVSTMNSIAKSKGAQGVKAALAPVLGGSAPMPTDRSLRYANGGVYPVQRFADGGIFGWIKSAGSALKGAGSAAWTKVKEGASWLKDSLAASAKAGVNAVVKPLMSRFPGMDTKLGQMISKVPDKIIDTLFSYSKKADDKGAGGLGGPRIAAGLKWAKTQAGKPYQWAGNGNPSWDCSGFMSAIESVIRGQKPHRRWATGAFSGKTAPPGWVYHGDSAFKIGITNAGVGHTAGTIAKTNVESRGGDGLVVGPRARGYNNPLFTSWYGFQPGKYDDGGWLQPGQLGINQLSKPEAVLTPSQWDALTTRGGGDPTPVVVEVHTRDQALAGFIDVRVQDSQQHLVQVLTAS